MPVIPALYGPDFQLIRSLADADEITICAGIPYKREMSRMHILSASGPLMLSIPVKKHLQRAALSEIRVDHMQKWRHQHWYSIASAYGKSPFFQYFKEELEEIFHFQTDLLAEFSARLLGWTLKQYFYGKKVKVNLAADYPEEFRNTDYLKPLAADKPKQEEKYRYRQVFGSEFADGLSTLDHLFCAGPKNIWRMQE